MATKKKRGKRGVKGGDVVRLHRLAPHEAIFSRQAGQWYWKRYAPNHEFICGSWPETFKRRVDCVKSAKRAQTPCEIVVDK